MISFLVKANRLRRLKLSKQSWIMVAFSVYAILVLYILLGNVLRERIAYPFLPMPFLVDQFYLLLTRTRHRLVYATNVFVIGFAIVAVFYFVVR